MLARLSVLTCGFYTFAMTTGALATQHGGPVVKHVTSHPSHASVGFGLGILALLGLFKAHHPKHNDGCVTTKPDEPGHACFREGTLIEMQDGWKAVESIAAGDMIATSPGPQIVRNISSWQPTEFRDRAFAHSGVWLTGNHRVRTGDLAVAVKLTSAERRAVDGAHYFHILVDQHAWLYAKADDASPVVECESLMLTGDIGLSRDFPGLADQHAAQPVALLIDTAEDLAAARPQALAA